MRNSEKIYKKILNGLIDLPGESAHKEMFPKRRVASEEIKMVDHYRISAVLAMLFEDNGLKMVLTQRHNYPGQHSGQISFPGGKMEDIDLDTVHTALRETQEEIGVDPNQIDVMGKLTDVFIPVSKFLVHPYIGYFDGIPQFIPSEREVKEIITFHLSSLVDPLTLQKRNIKVSSGMVLKDIPCFIIEKKVVWGATALILNEIRTILMR